MKIFSLVLFTAQAVSGAVIPCHEGHDEPEPSNTEGLIVITITSTKIVPPSPTYKTHLSMITSEQYKETPTALPSAAPPAAGSPSVIFITTTDYTTVPASGASPAPSSGASMSKGTSGAPLPSVTPSSGTLAVSDIPSLSGSPGTPSGSVIPSTASSESGVASVTTPVTQIGTNMGFESIPYESGYETLSYGSGVMSTADITSFTPAPSQAPGSSDTPAASQKPASSGVPAASQAPSPSGAPAASQAPTSALSQALASSSAAAPSGSYASSVGEYDDPPRAPASIQSTTFVHAPTASPPPESSFFFPGQTVRIHALQFSKQSNTAGSAPPNPISVSANAVPTAVVTIHDINPEDTKLQGAVNVPAGPGNAQLEDADFSFSAIKAESEGENPPSPLISLVHIFEHSTSSDTESIVTAVPEPTSAHHFNSMFTPKHSSNLIPTPTPSPNLSLAPASSKVPVSTPEPFKTVSSTVPAGSLITIGEGKHCPYPYPNEKCGKGAERTTFVTVAKSSVAPTSTTTLGWCPYPGQEC